MFVLSTFLSKKKILWITNEYYKFNKGGNLMDKIIFFMEN